jgi:hypothetical protein
MGQYYRPVILADNKKTVLTFLSSYDYGNGAKLMEHSYLGNSLVSAFETLIQDKPQRVVWGGDYADECKNRKTNLYQRCKDSLKAEQIDSKPIAEPNYIINHSKKEYVDKKLIRKMKAKWADGMKIHPLPLLTCEGNGRGGGDYRSDKDENNIGSWARDLFSVSNTKPEGFECVRVYFDED